MGLLSPFLVLRGAGGNARMFLEAFCHQRPKNTLAQRGFYAGPGPGPGPWPGRGRAGAGPGPLLTLLPPTRPRKKRTYTSRDRL